MREREIIARLRSLARHPAARGLADDAALFEGLVLTHDSMAEGVHFFPFDPPASVGWKLVAVNLSDLAAKGASPKAALLSLPISGDGQWEHEFIVGVEAACDSYGLALIGGDTIGLPKGAPRILGMTAIGAAGPNVPSRAGGASGDRLWLAGTVGDSAAGLEMLRNDRRATGALVDVYRRPVPLLAAGAALAPHAKAMMDVSDGLLIDALSLASASGCSARIALDLLPLSKDFAAARGAGIDARLFAATGGDDYAILAALPSTFDPAAQGLSDAFALTCIGELSDDGPRLGLTFNGTPAELPRNLGFEHRG